MAAQRGASYRVNESLRSATVTSETAESIGAALAEGLATGMTIVLPIVTLAVLLKMLQDLVQLGPAQAKVINQWVKQQGPRLAAAVKEDPEKALQKLSQLDSEVVELLEKTLSATQRDKLPQLLLTVAGPAALAKHEGLRKQLGVTDKQAAQIQARLETLAPEGSAIMRDKELSALRRTAKLVLFRRKRDKAIREIMTEEQLERLNQLKPKRFKFESLLE